MDPAKLKKLYDQKKTNDAERATRESGDRDRAHVEMQQRILAGHKAIDEIILPYFAEVEKAFGTKEFKYDRWNSAAGNDGAKFQIGNGADFFIEVIEDRVQISFGERNLAQGTKAFKPHFVLPHHEEPHIAIISDLTPEKLGKLIEIAIKKG